MTRDDNLFLVGRRRSATAASFLSPRLRRELLLRVLTLLFFVLLYIAALADDNTGNEALTTDAPALAAAWLALGGLYSSVATAIEEAEDTLE